MPTERHVFILGATGFLGEALARQWHDQPGVRLSLLIHQQESAGPRPGNLARVIRGSLGTFDLSWCRDDPPDWVFHCARRRGAGVMGRLWAAWQGRAANRRLIATLAALPRPPRVIYASGSLMYGSHGDDWVDEATPIAPISFAREYVVAERPFLEVSPGELPVTLVRPGWVLGDGSWFHWLCMDLSKATGAVPFFDDGLQWMSVIHRDDCATLMRWVAEQRFSGRICNLVAGEPLRHATFVEHLAQELALSIRRVPSRILRRRFDRASEVAVASSIRLRSLYAEEMSRVALRFRDPLKALRSVVAERRGRTRPATTAASG